MLFEEIHVQILQTDTRSSCCQCSNQNTCDPGTFTAPSRSSPQERVLERTYMLVGCIPQPSERLAGTQTPHRHPPPQAHMYCPAVHEVGLRTPSPRPPGSKNTHYSLRIARLPSGHNGTMHPPLPPEAHTVSSPSPLLLLLTLIQKMWHHKLIKGTLCMGHLLPQDEEAVPPPDEAALLREGVSCQEGLELLQVGGCAEQRRML